MKKRFLSLLCVLALCLGLLPVTALAAGEDAPSTLYVGSTPITSGGYWTSSDGGTTWTSQNDKPSDGSYIHYDSDSATLTLKDATIKGGSTDVSFGAGIYAVSSEGSDVALTINLEGTSTVSGDYGIYVQANQILGSGGNSALLTISGDGTLTATGNSGYGIAVFGYNGGAALTIENATVNASTSANYAAGVIVRSGSIASDSPQLSLAVNGGSLTASGGASSGGIQFYVGSPSATATTSLTVSGNAIVDAKTGGISATQDMSQFDTTISTTGNSGGIVFDGTEGTVYGEVTLDESLTINQGETLTIPEGSSLNCNGNLTNSGTINVESGGNLTGKPGGDGTVVSAPKITTDSLSSGTVGTAYNQVLQADNAPTQWSITSGSLPAGLSLGTDGTISGTPTTASTSTFTVTATNSAGSDSKEFSLTIQSATVPVTGVSLSETALSLFTGESANLTATVEPGNATNKNVTWSSDKSEVATVDNSGKVTAVGAGEATITVTTEDGSHTASCKVTVTQSIYKISADTTALDFGSACPGYTQPAAKTVTITNTGNQPLTLTQPASTSSFEVGTLSKTALAAGETVTFTVQPKAGLAAGTYSENITVSSSQSATVTIPASFAVKHNLYMVAAKAPTCTEDGNTAFWTCNTCGKVFSDESAENETTLEEIVISATGHSYGEPEWSWSEDGKTCTVTFTCANDNSHRTTETATVTSAVKTEAACTEKGVTTYTATVELNGKTYTATKDVADIPATGHSYENGKCKVCGAADPNYKPGSSNTTPTPTPAPAPTIVSGAESAWRKGSGVGLTFTSDADFAGFQGVMVDGTTISAQYYTAKAGSTVVTLKASYLETLAAGEHTVAIVSDTGTAGARFTILSGTSIPQTGDETNLAFWLGLLAASSLVLAGATLYRRKHKKEHRD